jgi:hypothetical protein
VGNRVVQAEVWTGGCRRMFYWIKSSCSRQAVPKEGTNPPGEDEPEDTGFTQTKQKKIGSVLGGAKKKKGKK